MSEGGEGERDVCESAGGAPGGGAAHDGGGGEPAEGEDEGRAGDAGDTRRARAEAVPVLLRGRCHLRHGHHQRLHLRHRVLVLVFFSFFWEVMIFLLCCLEIK